MAGLLYEKDEVCALCGQKFRVTKVRKSACPVAKRDADFCLYYENENPNLYDIWVCPHCGYAAPESSFTEMLEAQRKLVREWLTTQPKLPDLKGPRTAAQAVVSYDRAIGCATAKRGKASQVAGLWLKAAWIYRQGGDAREAEYIQKAAEFYEKAYQSEQTPIGSMSDLMLRYLIGELFRRCGRLKEAALYFSQLVSDPSSRSDPRISGMAREQWQITKEQIARGEGGAAAAEVAVASPEPAQAAPITPAATAAASPVQPESARPAAMVSRAARQRVSASVSLFVDQLEWAKRVSQACGPLGKIDVGNVVRTALDVAATVAPDKLASATEDELMQKLLAALRQS